MEGGPKGRKRSFPLLYSFTFNVPTAAAISPTQNTARSTPHVTPRHCMMAEKTT